MTFTADWRQLHDLTDLSSQRRAGVPYCGGRRGGEAFRTAHVAAFFSAFLSAGEFFVVTQVVELIVPLAASGFSSTGIRGRRSRCPSDRRMSASTQPLGDRRIGIRRSVRRRGDARRALRRLHRHRLVRLRHISHRLKRHRPRGQFGDALGRLIRNCFADRLLLVHGLRNRLADESWHPDLLVVPLVDRHLAIGRHRNRHILLFHPIISARDILVDGELFLDICVSTTGCIRVCVCTTGCGCVQVTCGGAYVATGFGWAHVT